MGVIKFNKKYFQFLPLVAVACYVLVMLIGGFGFLSLIGVAIAIFISLIILVYQLIKKRINAPLLLSYIAMIAGVLAFYLIWGAESFGRRLWYNLLLAGVPIALAVLLHFSDKLLKESLKKAMSLVVLVCILLTTSFYFLVISIRVRPTVTSLQKGHDEYLDSIKKSTQNNAPNVLIILMDDLGYSDISSYSYLGRENATIKTPNIDAIADDGIMMENFYASSPVCSPSRFGLLTGRYAARGYLDQVVFPTVVSLNPMGDTRYFNPFLFTNNVDGILGDEITLAEVMQRAGYNTGLFGKWNLGDYGQYLPTNQGFDYFYGSYYVNDMTPYNFVRETGGIGKEVIGHAEIKDQSETTKILTEELNTYIQDSLNKDEKFLAFYSTPWPHFPIYSGEKHNTSDDSYINCIEEFDAYLGTTIELLKANNAYEDTLIIFTSDNGPGREGVSGALRGRKGTTFDGGQKVPLIASYVAGGLGKGEHLGETNVISTRGMNIDIFPTVLEYIGISALPNDRIIDGVSLYDLFQGNIPSNTPREKSLFHFKAGTVQAIQKPVNLNGMSYDFKYYDKANSENTAFFEQVYRNYLFNLSTDPAEGYDIAMIHPEIAKAMNTEMIEFKKSLKDNRRGING
ncbi:MAG: sulfatase-like hydrolase/transferase [Clostridia bacterium]